ncbi:MAG: DNA polymerase Y family protein [Steroidobacteraceae bacterium]
MKSRAFALRQQSLLSPASTPLAPASPGGAGRGPPRQPHIQPTSSATRVAKSAPEWWAALQVPSEALVTLEALALRAQGFTSRVSLSPPDELLLELRGSLKLFGGADALKAGLQTAFPAPFRLAFATTPLAAQVCVRCDVAADLRDATTLVGTLARLPLDALRWPEDIPRRLAAVGVRTLGAALRLPRAGFARRFGPLALQTLDRLVGRCPDPRLQYVAKERFRRRCDPDVELVDQAAVLTRLTPLCEELERFLTVRQLGITSLALELVHRHRAPTRQVLRLAAPAHRAAQLLALLELQFGRTVLPAPVRRFELRSGPLVEGAADTTSLWRPGEHGGGAAVAQMPSFLEQLRARLGPDALSGLALASGHRPERLSLTPPPQLPRAAASKQGASAPSWKASRPLWLLEAPLGLAEQAGWPCREGRRLELNAGPERVESGWWDGFDVQRDYYRALDGAGTRLWIYRERIAPYRWFLHGFFG